MQIQNSSISDLENIFGLYRSAVDYQRTNVTTCGPNLSVFS
jgi:hypothetical protein